MENRRQNRTPFTSQGTVIFDSSGEIVAVFNTEPITRFVALACNRYDMLMSAFDLCRGEYDSMTMQPHAHPSRIAFHKISDALMDEIQKHGR